MRLGTVSVLFAVALAALPLRGAPVAFVADIRGAATIEGNGPLTFLAELPAGTRVLLGSNAAAAITYATSGTEFAIAGPGQFLVRADDVVAEKGPAPRRRAVASLADRAAVTRAAQTATASLRMRSIAQGPPPALLEYPVSTKISTLRPQLRFRTAPGEDYIVAVQDAAGRELWKGKGRADGTRPDVKLAPGTRYSWTVASARGALAEAHFETLSEDAMRRAERSRGASRSFAERVVHALLLQEVGADQESREAWAALARERPDMPQLPALAR
jgi:hypothetical protein